MAKRIETYYGDPKQVTDSSNAFLAKVANKNPQVYVQMGSSALLLPGDGKGTAVVGPGRMDVHVTNFIMLCIVIVYDE